jgi:AcrR family transcriptional regulator
MGMSIPYERSGRTKQKQRTREALIAAARELIDQGQTPTVEEAADRASISRTTAYRYFGSQRLLLLASYPEVETVSLLGPRAPRDPSARLAIVIEQFTSRVLETESQLRLALRLSLEPASGPRQQHLMRRGRAIAWIEEALSPLSTRMSPHAILRLAHAIRSAVGIEALIWLTDVAGHTRAEAVDLMRWSAQALLRAALEDARASKRKRARPSRAR